MCKVHIPGVSIRQRTFKRNGFGLKVLTSLREDFALTSRTKEQDVTSGMATNILRLAVLDSQNLSRLCSCGGNRAVHTWLIGLLFMFFSFQLGTIKSSNAIALMT